MEIKQHQIEQFAQAKARVKVRAEELEKTKNSAPVYTGTIWGKFGLKDYYRFNKKFLT